MLAKPEQQPEPEQHAGRAEHEPPQRDALIGNRVLRLLGRPGDLHRVQVRWLWESHYRVNVFVGADAASATVAHSYFLVADGDGNIVSSAPEIARRY